MPLLKKSDLKGHRNYFNKKTLLVYAVFTGNHNKFSEKNCSVALPFLQCSIDKSDTFLKHGGAFLQENATLLWHSVLIDFSGLGKRPKLET